jgi:DNA-binding HxlR family transcriptional regulator
MTSGQRYVLEDLADGPQVVAEMFDMGTKNAVRKRLRRLEDRGLVRRVYMNSPGYAAQWELTQAGRQALQNTT